jgi:5-formyltetrahydrofolate cyclo-ligase
MNSGALKRAKRAVRAHVLAARDALPADERAPADARIAERFLALPEIRRASAVMVFWSFGSEVATAPLIDALTARGVLVALPRIVDRELEARGYRPGDAVSATGFGAFEPEAGPSIAPEALDAIAVPAVAFDREGGRVGYGGGFYDRFLPTARPDVARIGLAYAVQVAPAGDRLPAGHFDLRVHAVVTESEVVRCEEPQGAAST